MEACKGNPGSFGTLPAWPLTISSTLGMVQASSQATMSDSTPPCLSFSELLSLLLTVANVIQVGIVDFSQEVRVSCALKETANAHCLQLGEVALHDRQCGRFTRRVV